MPKKIASVKKKLGKTIWASIGRKSILYAVADRVPTLVSLSGTSKKRLNKISSTIYIRYAYGVYSLISKDGIFSVSEDGIVLISVDSKKVKYAGIDYFNIMNIISDGREIVLILNFGKEHRLALIGKDGNIRTIPFSQKRKLEEPIALMKYNGEWVIISTSINEGGWIRISTLDGRNVGEIEIPWAKNISNVWAPFNGELALATKIYMKDTPSTRYGKPVVFSLDGKWTELEVCPSTPRRDLIADPCGPFIATSIGNKEVKHGRVFAFPFSIEYLFGPLYSVKSICCGNVLFTVKEKNGVYSLKVLFKEEYRGKNTFFHFPLTSSPP